MIGKGVRVVTSNQPRYGKTTVSKVLTAADKTNRVSGRITKRVQPS